MSALELSGTRKSSPAALLFRLKSSPQAAVLLPAYSSLHCQHFQGRFMQNSWSVSFKLKRSTFKDVSISELGKLFTFLFIKEITKIIVQGLISCIYYDFTDQARRILIRKLNLSLYLACISCQDLWTDTLVTLN